MGTINEKLDYLIETKAKIRQAIEYSRMGDELYKTMFMNNYNGTETFRDFKDYIDRLDRGILEPDACMIYYDGINNYVPDKGPAKHDASQWQTWSNLMPNGVDGQIMGGAEFDENSLIFSQNGDGLYIPANYVLHDHYNQFAIEMCCQITESTGTKQKLLHWGDCVEVWAEEVDGVMKVNVSTNWYETGFNEYIVRSFGAKEIEIGKPFTIVFVCGYDGRSEEGSYSSINRLFEVYSPKNGYGGGSQSGVTVYSEFNPEATGNFVIGYTDNGVDGTYVGDQAKMKLYSFRFFNRWIKNKHYTCEYLMRRFGFEEELFIDGSYFIS